MSKPDQLCLLVHRAGTTTIIPLHTGRSLLFGYEPPHPNDLILYDGSLESVEGEIEYRVEEDESLPSESDSNPTSKQSKEEETSFYLTANTERIKIIYDSGTIDDAPQALIPDVSIRLRKGNKIRVGDKYILIVDSYSPSKRLVEEHNKNGQQNSTAISGTSQTILDILGRQSRLYHEHLPEVYHASGVVQAGRLLGDKKQSADFLSRFLALFESVTVPLNWTIQHFYLYLHPASAPPEMLPWLANWFGFPLFDRLSIKQQRHLLLKAPDLIQQKGTVYGLDDFLKCYLQEPNKNDVQARDTLVYVSENDSGNKFALNTSNLPQEWKGEAKQGDLQTLVDFYRPAHAVWDRDFTAI